ncbi:MAG: hypothetical protein HY234_14025 [Acidobacteria bacterium]|nr:hypothetical protein [Acidobacteriota bacterium]
MFCPQCKSEYRKGFTRCKDCDIDLVAALPPGDNAELPLGESNSQRRFLAWFLPMAGFYLLTFLLMAIPGLARNEVVLFLLFVLVSSAVLGVYWMLYQVIRFERKMVPLVIFAFVPFGFVWYYLERFRKREGKARVPLALR